MSWALVIAALRRSPDLLWRSLSRFLAVYSLAATVVADFSVLPPTGAAPLLQASGQRVRRANRARRMRWLTEKSASKLSRTRRVQTRRLARFDTWGRCLETRSW